MVRAAGVLMVLLAVSSCTQRETAQRETAAARIRPRPIAPEIFRDLPDPERLLGMPFSFLEKTPHRYGAIVSRRRIDLGDYVWNPDQFPANYLALIATTEVVVFAHLEVGIGLGRHITYYEYR